MGFRIATSMLRFSDSVGWLLRAAHRASLATSNQEVQMGRRDDRTPDEFGKCERCSEVVVARGGWGLTTRFCIIRAVRMIVLCQVVVLTPHMTRLLGLG
jgi:hypothetical protein